MLDHLANRCFAQGTNAWTDVNHTAYTITTAGSQGFLNLLPVYLDHILYPTITDEGFLTEVHHITGEGENAGVVYCEMQGREIAASSILHRKLSGHLYPEPSGYRSETGGVLYNLRSLHVDKVREYHKSYYRPDNLYLIISGKIDAPELFQVLAKYENERILPKGPLPAMTRPWMSAVPPYPDSLQEIVPFPTDDEESGNVIIAWRGPKWEEFEINVAMGVLQNYLSESAVSILHKVFVEIEDPYCSDISASSLPYSETAYTFMFDSVPTEKLPEIKDLFFATLYQVVQDDGIDMTRMSDIIAKAILEHLNTVEENPHSAIQSSVIAHFLYGTSDSQLEPSMSPLSHLNALKSRDDQYWIALLQERFIDAPHLCLIGTPSAQLGKTLQKNEKGRLTNQKKRLGPAKLKELGLALDDAMAKHKVQPPLSIIQQFHIPDVNKIPLLSIKSIRNEEPLAQYDPAFLKHMNEGQPGPLPFFLQFDHINSSFVQHRVMLDTASLPENLRPYLALYLDTLFELPLMRDGSLVPHEEVVTQLERDTAYYWAKVGYGGNFFDCGSWSRYVVMEFKYPIENYVKAVQWLREILWQTQFSASRLKIAANKILADIPTLKRKGDFINRTALQELEFGKESNQHAMNFQRQHKFLSALAKKLKKGSKDEVKQVVEDLEKFRSILCDPKNMMVQVLCDFSKVSHPKEAWHTFLPSSFSENYVSQVSPPRFAKEALSPFSASKVAIGISSIETTFLKQTLPIDLTYGHFDEAALLVLLEYLTALEGAFWNKIRGEGLAYGYNISLQLEMARVIFDLTKSSNVTKAYEVSKQIFADFLSGKEVFEKTKVESAKSGCICAIFSREDNYESAGLQSLTKYLKGIGADGNRQLLAAIQKVTAEDLLSVLQKYLKNLFDPASVSIAVTTNSGKVKDTLPKFQEQEVTLQQVSVDTFFK
eukprot:TRINITY_DN3047_c0_g1_i2.p1 TRINITY_DN3047_c0_g1~~TRINITY_DN3047_c0_g1_i2.p1  ORF type:complete len:1020 (-),score=257.93 TRINITY_DN3047_c0_g1_i2:13-2829(-)